MNVYDTYCIVQEHPEVHTHDYHGLLESLYLEVIPRSRNGQYLHVFVTVQHSS